MSKKAEIHLYTDGSYHSSSKRGGYASIIPELGQIVCGNDTNTTNNKMELQAVISGLKHLDITDRHVVVHSDSRYITDAFNKRWLSNWKKNGWKTQNGQDVKNKEEWDSLLEEVSKHKKVKFEWVRGHNGDTFNEAVDDLANTICKYKGK